MVLSKRDSHGTKFLPKTRRINKKKLFQLANFQITIHGIVVRPHVVTGWHTEKTVSISFHIESDMIVVTVFPFDFEPNGIPFGSKSKGKLSLRSYPIQCERKWKQFSRYNPPIPYNIEHPHDCTFPYPGLYPDIP